MKKNKTQERRLAELIARQENIKVKSAMRRIQRAVKAEKPVRASADLSDYARRKFRDVVKQKKVERYVKRPEPVDRGPVRIPERIRRVDYAFDATQLLTFRGRVDLGSGKKKKDIRDRAVNIPITAKQANRIFNAPDRETAAEEFRRLVPYVNEVIRFDSFEFGGKKIDETFFD